MSWSLLVAAAGIVLGLRFRAGAMMAATLMVVILGLVFQAPDHGFGWSLLWFEIQLAICLQAGYLAGLTVAGFRRGWREGAE